MRKALLLICSILITSILPVMADDISVISFKRLDTDLTANTRGTQKLDQNGEKAALIKIVTPERGGRRDMALRTATRSEAHHHP